MYLPYLVCISAYMYMLCKRACVQITSLLQGTTGQWHWKLQSDTLLSMQRQNSQSSDKERFIAFKCKPCSKKFDSSRAYRCHCTSPQTQGTQCSLEQKIRNDVHSPFRPFYSRAVLRQCSLARLGVLFKILQHRKRQIITIIRTMHK